VHQSEYLQQDLKQIGDHYPPTVPTASFDLVTDKPLQLHWFAFPQSQHLRQPSNFKPLLRITLNYYKLLLATIASNNKARCRLGNLTPRFVPIVQIGNSIMTDFAPRPDRAATHASNALRSLEDLKELLADLPPDDIRLSLLELAIAEIKVSRYHSDGNPAPLMPPTVSLQTALSDLGVKFNG
jgi:hypothetical protein